MSNIPKQYDHPMGHLHCVGVFARDVRKEFELQYNCYCQCRGAPELNGERLQVTLEGLMVTYGDILIRYYQSFEHGNMSWLSACVFAARELGIKSFRMSQ